MISKQSSAFKILNGKLEWRLRKCLFSVTNISAPVHSVYAAIKASAGFRPSNSYFAPNSKGTTKSSSIVVRFVINSINSLNSSGVRWRLTSSIINLGMRIECIGNTSRIVSTRILEAGFFSIPKENIYSLESRTSSKFFIPEFFSCFAQGFNYFFFCHIRERMFSLRYKFTQFTEMLLCFFNIWFWHNYYLFICNIPQQRGDVKCHKCHSRSVSERESSRGNPL